MFLRTSHCLLLAFFFFRSSSVHADKEELRLTASGNFNSVELSVFEGTGSNLTFGGGLTMAFGFFDWLEGGVKLGHQFAKDASIKGAALNGTGGDDRHELFATLRIFDLNVVTRAYLELGPFLRLRPLVGFGVGLQVNQFSGSELFFEDGAVVATKKSDWTAAFLTTGEVGMSYRLSDRFESAIIANTSVTDVAKSYGINLEISWMH